MVVHSQQPRFWLCVRPICCRLLGLICLFAATGGSSVSGYADSVAFLVGARGLVPCSDGSVIGGFINCPTYTVATSGDQCTRPVLTRSWDGGRTWNAEYVAAPDYALTPIVRLQDGRLLTAHHRYTNQFMESTDDGRSWREIFDTSKAEKRYSRNEMSVYLLRDFRGIIFWKGAGELCMSFDGGITYATLAYAPRIYPVFFVIPPNGLIVVPQIGAGYWPGEIFMSFDHGRNWQSTLKGDEVPSGSKDSTLVIPAVLVVRDTFAVQTGSRYGWAGQDSTVSRSLYWNDAGGFWATGPNLGDCFMFDAILDSSEVIYGSYSASIATQPKGSTQCVEVGKYLAPGDTIPAGDDSTVYYRSSLEGIYYDFDGGVHPYGSEGIIPTGLTRPISLLDREYSCTEISFVIGGRQLTGVYVNEIESMNAAMKYRVSPNGRVAFVTVSAVDSSKPLRVGLSVHDAQLGTQVFRDSIAVLGSVPVVSTSYQFNTPHINCTWIGGPFVWMKDGKPWVYPGTNEVHNDSTVASPEPGTYRAYGVTKYGCRVLSNEITISLSSVHFHGVGNEQVAEWQLADNTLVVNRTSKTEDPVLICVYNLVGQLIAREEMPAGAAQAKFQITDYEKVVYVVAMNNSGVIDSDILYRP